MHFRTKKNIVLNAILACLGILFGYAEMLLVPDLFFPGMKLGISNIVVLFAVMTLRKRDVFCIGIIKAIVNGLIFSGLTSCFYSITGVIFSVSVMCGLRRMYTSNKISAIGISVAGSAFFNLGQILAACLVLRAFAPVYYLNYYLFLSVVTGAVTGTVVQIILNKGVVKRFEKK